MQYRGELSQLPTLVALVALVAGCGSDGAGDSEPATSSEIRVYNGSCGESLLESRPLGWDERSPLGFSGQELLENLGTERQTSFTYDDGASTLVTLGLAPGSGSVLFHESAKGDRPTPLSDDELADDRAFIEPGCWNMVAVPATLSFTTRDGAFADTWPATLLAYEPTVASGDAPIDLEALRGNYALSAINPADYDALQAYAALAFDVEAWSGTLQGAATKILSSGPEGIARADLLVIGRF